MRFDQGSTKEHQDLIKDFIKEVSRIFPDVMIVPYTVGMFRDFDSAERIIHACQKGFPYTLILGCGWYLLFDGKTGNARFSKEQAAIAERIKTINKGTDHVYKLKSLEDGIKIIKK